MKNTLKLVFAILLVLLVIILIRYLPKNQTIQNSTSTPSPAQTEEKTETPTVTIKAENEDDLQKLIDADQDNAYEEELTGLESETQ